MRSLASFICIVLFILISIKVTAQEGKENRKDREKEIRDAREKGIVREKAAMKAAKVNDDILHDKEGMKRANRDLDIMSPAERMKAASDRAKGFTSSTLSTRSRFKSRALLIQLPQNIFLNLPDKATFNVIPGETAIRFVDYTLSKAVNVELPQADSAKGRLFNPHVIRDYADTSSYSTSRYKFNADYLSLATAKTYSFKFPEIDDSINSGVGISGTEITVPTSWRKVLGNEKIESVWFKCHVNIDEEGFPVEKMGCAEPILVKTDHGLYSCTAIDAPAKAFSANMLEPSYSAFIMQNCAPDNLVMDNFTKVVLERILKALQSDPFMAVRYDDISMPNHEIWLKTNDRTSIILGDPYYERSTYIVRWEHIRINNNDGVKLNICHCLTRAVGAKGTFSEPSITEFNKFKEQINKWASASVRNTCENLKLNFYNNTCNCK